MAPKLVSTIGALPHDELTRCGDLLGSRLVHLVDEGDIARRQLPDRVLRLRVHLGEANRVNQANGALVRDPRKAVRLGEQLAHARGVRKPRRLDEHDIAVFLDETLQRALELVDAARAEHRAARNLVKFRAELGKEGAIDALPAEVVDDELHLLPREQADEVLEEGRFACPQKTRYQIQLRHLACSPALFYAPIFSRASSIAALSSSLEGMIDFHLSSPFRYIDGRLGTPILTQRATLSL